MVLLTGSRFAVCGHNLLSKEEIPNKETSLRSVATVQSVGSGQAMQKCNCKGGCKNNICGCRKNSLLRNSRCHTGKSCWNFV